MVKFIEQTRDNDASSGDKMWVSISSIGWKKKNIHKLICPRNFDKFEFESNVDKLTFESIDTANSSENKIKFNRFTENGCRIRFF